MKKIKSNLLAKYTKFQEENNFLLILGFAVLIVVMISFIFLPLDNLKFGLISSRQDFNESLAARKDKDKDKTTQLLTPDESKARVQSLPDELKQLIDGELSKQSDASWVVIGGNRDFAVYYVVRDSSIAVKISDASRESEIKAVAKEFLKDLEVDKSGLKVTYSTKPKL